MSISQNLPLEAVRLSQITAGSHSWQKSNDQWSIRAKRTSVWIVIVRPALGSHGPESRGVSHVPREGAGRAIFFCASKHVRQQRRLHNSPCSANMRVIVIGQGHTVTSMTAMTMMTMWEDAMVYGNVACGREFRAWPAVLDSRVVSLTQFWQTKVLPSRLWPFGYEPCRRSRWPLRDGRRRCRAGNEAHNDSKLSFDRKIKLFCAPTYPQGCRGLLNFRVQ